VIYEIWTSVKNYMKIILNDSTIYINLDEKRFQYGVIGFHVIKRYGFGNP